MVDLALELSTQGIGELAGDFLERFGDAREVGMVGDGLGCGAQAHVEPHQGAAGFGELDEDIEGGDFRGPVALRKHFVRLFLEFAKFLELELAVMVALMRANNGFDFFHGHRRIILGYERG